MAMFRVRRQVANGGFGSTCAAIASFERVSSSTYCRRGSRILALRFAPQGDIYIAIFLPPRWLNRGFA
jgi:hypothetical protein